MQTEFHEVNNQDDGETSERIKRQKLSEDPQDLLVPKEGTPTKKLGPKSIEMLREFSVEKKQETLSKILALRERQLREIVYLEQGGNLFDFDGSSPSLVVLLEEYHAKHQLVTLTDLPPPSDKRKRGLLVSTPSKSATTIRIQLKGLPVTSPHNQANTILKLDKTSIFNKPEESNGDILAKAAKDAEILQKVTQLQREGLWSSKRLLKQPEPPRHKVHWDSLLAEMVWLANDFIQARKLKTRVARKLSSQVHKYHEAIRTKEERQVKEEELRLRKMAKSVATEVKRFWAQIDKLALYKQQVKIEALKKKALGNQLDKLVVQTEQYSKMLAQDLSSASTPSEQQAAPPPAVDQVSQEKSNEATKAEGNLKSFMEHNYEKELEPHEDQEFAPAQQEESDDETTIDQEEAQPKVDNEDGEEVSLLKKESEMPIEAILDHYTGSTRSSGALNDEEDEDEEEEDNEEEEEEEEQFANSTDKSTQDIIAEAASAAKEAQPTGFTLSTTTVKTTVPFLLRGTLREYQHIGLDWLVTMYDKRLNGILADEMGLGKTIMTIALLAHLACEKGIWGPHLIIVPTSTMLNWELELKRWCPAFKVLTYFGSLKERKLKRQGWSKPNSFHVCITSYKLVLQDHAAFRRKKWKYLILDEAQHIKNFKSQRWQTLLNFNTSRRLLLTGTPLQNNLMELWSFMHFLMPHIFQSHKEFKDWFSNPVHSMIEGEQEINEDLINRLHGVLRPFILRRLKSEVEKQLPPKIEHIVRCRLSKRQRFLYEEFMASSSTQSTLSSGNFLGIVNVLMQLRKVTNHPDLFETRPIISPFDQDQLIFETASLATKILDPDPYSLDYSFLNLSVASNELNMATFHAELSSKLMAKSTQLTDLIPPPPAAAPAEPASVLSTFKAEREERQLQARIATMKHIAYVNGYRCNQGPLYGYNLCGTVTVPSLMNVHTVAKNPRTFLEFSSVLQDMIVLPERRAEELKPILTHFVCIIPSARAPSIELHCSHPNPSKRNAERQWMNALMEEVSSTTDIYRPAFVRSQLYFPDKRLIQYDCGKLQELSVLLRHLKAGGHKALIFTQMTRMLDILEIFLNIYGYTYLRLDGATKVERRQMLMERFNKDPRVFLFILSTRSGGTTTTSLY